MAARARLLGTPAFGVDGGSLEPAPGKDAAIVAYLAWRGTWTSRDELAGLVWADRRDAVARRNLRQAVFRLRRSELASVLVVEAERIRFDGTSDVGDFLRAVERGDWPEALQLRRGPFLEGWDLEALPDVARWTRRVRDELDARWRTALAAWARELEHRGDLMEAARLHGLAWREDVLDEASLVAALSLLSRSGHTAEAAREASAYRAAFEHAMGFPPDGALLSVTRRTSPNTRSASGGAVPPRLPRETTPFVGRAAETAELRARLGDPDVRLVTVVGMGGTGKTRLALRVTGDLARQGTTVAWASLEPIERDDEVPRTLARAWGLAGPDAATIDAVADAIGESRAVLVIDNAEHVANGVRTSIAVLLERCPDLVVLTTSRVSLGLRAEHVFALHGLSLGADGSAGDAARLFATAAARRSPDHDPAHDAGVVDAICREVGGLPLALELLASWSNVLSPREMLDEVRSGSTILRSSAVDRPDRQRAMTAVLDASFGLLGDEGRAAFLALAPFRGGFDLDAARAVGATPQGLQELVRTLLVHRDGPRFARHPLVRRFALERAEGDPASLRDARRRHGAHMLARLEALERPLLRQSGLEPARRLYAEDAANVREALLWACETLDAPTFVRHHQTLEILEWTFAREHDSTFVADVARRSRGGARAHMTHKAIEIEISEAGPDLDAARAEALEARASALVDEAATLDDRLLASRAQRSLARLRLTSGDPAGARDHARRAIDALRDHEGVWGWVGEGASAYAYRLLAASQAAAGRYAEARHDLLRAIAQFAATGDPGLPERSRLLQLDVAFGHYARAADVAAATDACLPDEAPATARLRIHLDRARLHLARGERREALDAFDRAETASGEVLGPLRDRRRASIEGLRAQQALLDGEAERAARHLGHASDTAIDRARRAHLDLLRDRPEDAAQRARAAIEVAPRRLLHPFVHGYAQCLTSLALAASSRHEAALREALDALGWARAVARPPEALRACVPAARLALRAAPDRAERLLRRVGGDPRSDAITRVLAQGVRDRLDLADGRTATRGVLRALDEAEALVGEPSHDLPRPAG